MDIWDIWGLGGTPEFFAGGGDPQNLPLLSIGSAAPALASINRSTMGPWDAIASIGSAAIQAFAGPQTMPTISPEDQARQALDQFGLQNLTQNIPQVMARSFPSNCATTAGMAGLNCVVHQSGPFKGKLIKRSTRRRIKLVPDGQGSLMPVICCTKPRMNPLNPRALKRATTRLARFQHIARGIDAMITRQIKSRPRGGGRRAGWCMPASPRRRCLPARCP